MQPLTGLWGTRECRLATTDMEALTGFGGVRCPLKVARQTRQNLCDHPPYAEGGPFCDLINERPYSSIIAEKQNPLLKCSLWET